jgi:hypothetical protein
MLKAVPIQKNPVFYQDFFNDPYLITEAPFCQYIVRHTNFRLEPKPIPTKWKPKGFRYIKYVCYLLIDTYYLLIACVGQPSTACWQSFPGVPHASGWATSDLPSVPRVNTPGQRLTQVPQPRHLVLSTATIMMHVSE